MKIKTSHISSTIYYLLTLSLLGSTPVQSGQRYNPSLYASAAGFHASTTTNRLIVKYRNASESNTLPTGMTNLVESLSGETSSVVKETFSGAKVIQLGQKIPIGEMQTIANEIQRQDIVEYAEPDLIMHPFFTPNDPRYSEQWHYYQQPGGINLPAAWDITQGANVTVAVVDSGYQPHSDLNQNLLPGYDMISDPVVAKDGDGRDSDPTDEGDYEPSCDDYISTWHGTHVAGTIAAITDNASGVAGIAHQAKIVPVRVIGRCGGYLSDIMDGVAWAAGAEIPNVPINPNPAQVINLSLGGSSTACPDTALTAIETARQLGATVIAAAGNDNANSASFAPANCPGVITVAATDENGDLASFSNFGSVVDLSAPGINILSTYNDGVIDPGNESYRLMFGTSMAAPHVSGVAALLYSLKSDITPDEVAQILTQSAQAFPNGCIGCGSGILDASAALEMLEPTDPGITQLSDGIEVTNLTADTDEMLMFAVDVPANAISLSIHSYGGNGDADLYVRHEAEPTLTTFECRPYRYNSDEQCSFRPATPGRYYVMLHSYRAFSSVSLIADYMLDDPQPIPGEVFENQNDYSIPQSSLSGIFSPIEVDRTGATGQINVEVGINHNWTREVAVTLIDPTGRKHTLKGFGGSGVDLYETYSIDLGDIPSEGAWKLQVMDLGPVAIGNIDFWRIIFP